MYHFCLADPLSQHGYIKNCHTTSSCSQLTKTWVLKTRQILLKIFPAKSLLRTLDVCVNLKYETILCMWTSELKKGSNSKYKTAELLFMEQLQQELALQLPAVPVKNSFPVFKNVRITAERTLKCVWWWKWIPFNKLNLLNFSKNTVGGFHCISNDF